MRRIVNVCRLAAMTPHRPIRRLATLVAAASLAVLLLPGLAAAHSELVSSVPAANAVVPSPYTGPIVLTFSEHLASGSKADLVDASGATVASATVDANAKTMTFTLDDAAAPGRLRGQLGEHRRRRRPPPPARRALHGRAPVHRRLPSSVGFGRSRAPRPPRLLPPATAPSAAPTVAPSPSAAGATPPGAAATS